MRGFFDCNATTPLHPAARTAWLEASDRFWHNPSGLYREAAAAKHALEDAREQVADWLDCGAEEIVFLSGATEANNAVMRHWASGPQSGSLTESPHPVVAVSALEHPSVTEPAAKEFPPDRLRVIPSGPDGVMEWEALRSMLQNDRPWGVSVMAANNETGVLQPWPRIRELCQESGAAFHCDAAQWIGKKPAAGLGRCDFVTGSAHKFGGPKGIGFLKTPTGGRPLRWLRGGPQEERRRAGTENVPAVLAMVAAWSAAEKDLAEREPSRVEARNTFESRLQALLPEVEMIAANSPRLWNTSLIVVPPPSNLKWLARLSTRGFQVSTGSACSQGGGASEVLRAMGVPEGKLSQVLRLSGGWETTPEDWLALADAIAEVAGGMDGRPSELSGPAGRMGGGIGI